MMKRKCANCRKPIPPETEHFNHDDGTYCTECVTVTSYTSYTYYVEDEYLGDSNDESVQHVEYYEDDYEEEEESE